MGTPHRAHRQPPESENPSNLDSMNIISLFHHFIFNHFFASNYIAFDLNKINCSGETGARAKPSQKLRPTCAKPEHIHLFFSSLFKRSACHLNVCFLRRAISWFFLSNRHLTMILHITD